MIQMIINSNNMIDLEIISSGVLELEVRKLYKVISYYFQIILQILFLKGLTKIKSKITIFKTHKEIIKIYNLKYF